MCDGTYCLLEADPELPLLDSHSALVLTLSEAYIHPIKKAKIDSQIRLYAGLVTDGSTELQYVQIR